MSGSPGQIRCPAHQNTGKLGKASLCPTWASQGEKNLSTRPSRLLPQLSLPVWPACFPVGWEKFTAHKFCGAMGPERPPWQADTWQGVLAASCQPWHRHLFSLPSHFWSPRSHRGHLPVPSKAVPLAGWASSAVRREAVADMPTV